VTCLEVFHGTWIHVAQDLVDGKVDVTRGGGELGRGFYTQDELYNAMAWAYRVTGGIKAAAAAGFEMLEEDFYALNPLCLTYDQALEKRRRIRSQEATRTFLFDRNVVWGPIVGGQSTSLRFDQHKYESTAAQAHLNGPDVKRRFA
jgi:hypothetical protein